MRVTLVILIYFENISTYYSIERSGKTRVGRLKERDAQNINTDDISEIAIQRRVLFKCVETYRPRDECVVREIDLFRGAMRVNRSKNVNRKKTKKEKKEDVSHG